MPEIIRKNGIAEWKAKPGDAYVVTGLDRRGRRFRLIFASWDIARMINVWRGSFWLLRNNRKYLIQRRFN